MLLTISTAVASLLLAFALLQLGMAIQFRRQLKRQEGIFDDVQPVGRAAVVLSVRGCDPSLRHCLIGLLDQEYQDYEVHVVVDNQADAAWRVVQEIREEFDLQHRLSVCEMQSPQETCSLKCSALVQALGRIGPEVEYLVLLDADVRPGRRWLRTVLAPLSDPGIGVVTGNQWFEPGPTADAGSLVRSLWNAGAIVPTALYANPWGGTCAMRMKSVFASGLDQIWQKSVVDDGPLREAIEPLQLRVHFEPALIMSNSERCSLEFVNRYIARMLTWSRLHERTFVNTLVHAVFSNSVLLATCGLWVASIVIGNLPAAAVTAGGLLAFSLCSLVGYKVVRRTAYLDRIPAAERPSFSLGYQIRLALLIPFTQLVYGWSCLRAVRTRQVRWREITYEVRSPSQIRMVSYQPLLTEPEYANSEMSI